MRRAFRFIAAGTLSTLLAAGNCLEAQEQKQKISDLDRERAAKMLDDMHDALKKNYYDATFHGIDINARLSEYKERLKKAETLGDAFRTVAAYLAGLNDSHTVFIPPRISYRAEYGYQLEMIGDNAFLTHVRPGFDAEEKLHVGDQVLSLNGFAVNRKDLWQLEYYLNLLDPKPATDFTLRDPSGKIRKEQVLTKYIERKLMKDLTAAGGFNDNYNLLFEEEKARHVLRSRYIEQGELIIWKMPVFELTDGEVDRLIGMARNHKKLILDLRGNPGGYDFTLQRMLGSFFDHDVKIGVRMTRKGEKPEIAKTRGNAAFKGDTVVIIDSSSASAAELFARIMQLEGRAKIIGDRSSGRVMESLYYPYHEGVDIQVFYGASITVADLVMTDGKSLEKVGVTPNEIVLPTGSQLAEGHDPVLARAAELVGITLDPMAAGKLFPFEWVPLEGHN